MTITIKGNVAVQNVNTGVATKAKPEINTETKEVTLSKDQLGTSGVKRGVVPFLKGAGAGALGGGLLAGTGAGLLFLPAMIKGSEGAGYVIFAAPVSAIAGLIPGAIAGGVAANLTDNKLAATLAGAGAGAIGGAIWGLTHGDILFPTVIGAVSGAGGGFAGALVAKKNK